MNISNHIIKVIIPAYNEEHAIGKVIEEIPDYVHEIVVANNGSTDNTFLVASNAGAMVREAPKMGYGNACLTAMDYIEKNEPKPTIVVFIDGDYSDYPQEMDLLIQPIISNQADLVIGSRALGNREKGSMTLPQIFGNWLATTLLKGFYKVKFTDLGPFRAISYESLVKLGMKDRNYGWTVEMQLKAAKMKMRCTEVSVNYRNRIGKSKVSGTIKGTVMAGYKILFTIFRHL